MDIGEGVMVKREDLSAAKLTSHGPSTLARNLFRILFKKEELVGKSLLGRMCNANKHLNPLPAVDSLRRDAIICMYDCVVISIVKKTF